MKNKYFWGIIFIMMFLTFTSCDKDESDDNLHANALILGFNQEKCECCWGWIIKFGNDTIMSDNLIVGEIVGYDINKPINVYIEIGDKVRDCPIILPSPDYSKDYFVIKKIVKIEE